MPVGRWVIRTAESVLLTCWPPAPLGAVGVDPEVALVDVDVVVLRQQRGDDHLCEGGVTPVSRVERRLADEPVHPPLRLVGAVGVLAFHGHRCRLEPCLLSRARLDQLRLIAAIGRPAEVHPEHHLGPVLRIRAAGAGVDRDHRITQIVLAVEERVLLQPRELDRNGQQLGAQLVLERRVDLEQLGCLLHLTVEAVVAVEPARQPGVLGGDAGRLLLVVPETGRAHQGFELFLAGRQLNGSKVLTNPVELGSELLEQLRERLVLLVGHGRILDEGPGIGVLVGEGMNRAAWSARSAMRPVPRCSSSRPRCDVFRPPAVSAPIPGLHLSCEAGEQPTPARATRPARSRSSRARRGRRRSLPPRR